MSSSSPSELASLLQHLKRSTNAFVPNQVLALLGTKLAQLCDPEKQDEILDLLTSNKTNPSVVFAFFDNLQGVDENTLHHWIIKNQDGDSKNFLKAAIRCFARLENLETAKVVETYLRLDSRDTRLDLAREIVFQTPPRLMQQRLSPIVGASVLNPSLQLLERQLVLEGIMRKCRRSSQKDAGACLEWMLESLVLFLKGDEVDGSHISHQWAMEWVDLLSISETDKDTQSDLFSKFCIGVLPHFLDDPSCLLQPLLMISDRCERINEKASFHLAMCALSTPIRTNAQSALQLLIDVCPNADLTTIVSDILARRSPNEPNVGTPVLEALGISNTDRSVILKTAKAAVADIDGKLSVSTQNSLLLLGCLLWKEKEGKLAKEFLRAVVQKFLHLGIPLLPTLLESIQTAPNGQVLLERIDFLCDTVVHDPHCAQQVWGLVGGTLCQPSQPLDIHLLAIRTFPSLCRNNRRLYRRIIDALGNLIESRQAEIRMASITAVVKMAEGDLIRDVSDVIGWVQTYLQDEVPAIRGLAVTSLHHLVVSGELDFDLVIKVLSKRLCDIGELEQLMALHPIVLESLIVLLGDGEVEADSEEEGSDGGISPQVSNAVRALFDMARTDLPSIGHSQDGARRIRHRIFVSLSKYHEALEIDEESIQSVINRGEDDSSKSTVPDNGIRYVMLRDILKQGLMEQLVEGNSDTDPIVELAQRVVYLEEEALGASIWQKGVKSSAENIKASARPQKPSKAAVAALPTPEMVQEEYMESPSTETALGALQCFDGVNVENLVDYIGDLSTETLDPIQQVLCLQGWLQAMARTWNKISSSANSVGESLELAIETIEGWLDLADESDNIYLAMSALAIYIPDSFQSPVTNNDFSFVEQLDKLHEQVLGAFEKHQFTQKSAAHLSIALIAARSSSRRMGIVDELRKVIEGGSANFGTYFGLGLVARAALVHSEPSAQLPEQRDFCSILGVLFQELLSCTTEKPPPLSTLVASLKGGSVPSELQEQIRQTSQVSIEADSVSQCHRIQIALAGCLTVLRGVDDAIFSCVVEAIGLFPWESGKAIPLSSVQLDSNLEESLASEASSFIENSDSPASTVLCLLASLAAKGRDRKTHWLSKYSSSIQASTDNLGFLSFIALSGTFPLLGLNTNETFSTPSLLATSASKEIKSSLGILSEQNGPLVRGYFASLSFPEVKVDSHSSKIGQRDTSNAALLDLSKLPTPHPETVLFLVVDSLQSLVKQRSPLLNRHLSSLSKLSLPSQFASSLIEPMLSPDAPNETNTQETAAALLVSQFEGRRRATFDGKDFVNLATRILSSDEFVLSPKSLETFCRSIHSLLRRCRTDSVPDLVTRSWELCLALEDAEFVCAKDWIESIKVLLLESKSSSVYSPRTVSFVAGFLARDVSRSVAKLVKLNSKILSVAGCVGDCLTSLEGDILNDNGLLSAERDTPTIELLVQAYCVSVLLKAGSVRDHMIRQVVTKLASWLSSLSLPAQSLPSIHGILLAIGENTAVIELSLKGSVVVTLLESILIQGKDSASLTVLAVLLSMWNGGPDSSLTRVLMSGHELGSNTTEETTLGMIEENLEELPQNLGMFSRMSQLSSQLANLLVRIHAGGLLPAKHMVPMLNAVKADGSSRENILMAISDALAGGF